MTNNNQSDKVRRKWILLMILVLFIAAIGYGQFRLRRASALQIFTETISYVTTSEKIVALTFDDGPNPNATEPILDILREHGVLATFFVTGENAKRHPDLIRRIIAEGHELGNHSWDHTRLTYKSPDFIRQQIQQTDELLRYLEYDGTIHFHAPFGHGLFILPHTLMRMERPHILWSITLYDWEDISPVDMLEKLDRQIAPGAIILLHDGYTEDEYQSRQATVELVEMILQTYLAEGYTFATISTLVDKQY